MNSYDKYKEGLHDDNSPINQQDLDLNESNEFETIEGAIDGEEYERATEILAEVMRQVNLLREYARCNENVYLLKRLNEIYNLL